jgi:hypothetical protein
MLWAPKTASSKPAWPVLADYASDYRTVETVSSHWQVVGDQINRSWVCNGSAAGLRELDLDAADLPVERLCHTAD